MTTDRDNLTPSLVSVDFHCLPKLNYAMHQNGVNVIRSLVVCNGSDLDYSNLEIKIVPADAFAAELCSHVDFLGKNQKLNISNVELVVDAGFILQLTERLESSFNVTVECEGNVLFSSNYPISVLAYNEWQGTGSEVEMLASFVTPNSPAIAPILARAAAILKEWTGNSALDGYQSKNVDRIKKIAGAVFEAIRELHIVYSNPPASFEQNGQRIRMVDEVLTSKLATCLDSALLYASCLEATGLFPLLVLLNGHAFAGVWLVSDTLQNVAYDDSSLLSKHVGLNDIILVETTLMNDSSSCDFDTACAKALQELEAPSSFVGVIDVARCRFTGIRPLPLRVRDGERWIVDSKSEELSQHYQPSQIDRYEIGTQDETEVTKQNIWERKLLDLSLRNALLNYRISKKSMILFSADIAKLEDAIWTGDVFQIMPCPKEFEPLVENDSHIGSILDSKLKDLLKQQLDNKRLYTCLNEHDNTDVLKALYRAAKVNIEENGANSLYLAIGMLRWTEPKVEKYYYAPILLVPVELVRRGAGYVLRSRDEETLLNVTLVEMLRQNFQLSVTGLSPLPIDEMGVDVGKVLAVFRNAILSQKGWDVLEMAVLGNFSFSKFIMWNDIHSNIDALRKNKIVQSLVDGKLAWVEDSADVEARNLDHELSPVDLALPIIADSSQLEAVYAAASGKSFILHGPPGTGKSQTITNIIANALYHGKRVLFAAEKMAALSVVQERLAKIGLAPFCLEVHSNKAKKSDVLAQLQSSAEITKVKSPAEFEAESKKLFELRQQLNGYVEALHKPTSCNVSLYEAITRYCSMSDGVEQTAVSFPTDMVAAVTVEQLDLWKTGLEQLVIVSESCGHPATHPLRFLFFDEFTPALQSQIGELAHKGVELLKEVKTIAQKLPFVLDTKEKFDSLLRLAEGISGLPNMNGPFLCQPDVRTNYSQIISTLESGKHAQEICDDILDRYTDGVFAIPADVLRKQWNEAEQKWFLSKWVAQRGVKKQLAKYAKSSVGDVAHDLDLLVSYQQEQRKLKENEHTLSLFGTHSRTTVDDWNEMAAMENGLLEIHNALLFLADDVAQMVAYKKQLAEQMSDGFSSFLSFAGADYVRLAEIGSAYRQNSSMIKDVAGVDDNACASGLDLFIDGRLQVLELVEQNLSKLKDRFNYLLSRRKLSDMGLSFFVDAIESNENLPIPDWNTTFLCGFYKSLAEHLFSQDQNLTLFKGDIFEANIKRFRNMNAQYQELVKAELYAKLAANHPDFTVEAASSSEVGILQKNIHNKGRGTSLRALFDAVPTMLSKLTPCMLMSPMSIAQYLDVNKHNKFDLVIFDEASQMPTSEAVGAIARGENVIVVGDPKQMPPTSFFSTNNVDEDTTDLNDLDSILDDCLALSIPSKYLRFHYRSKHESLIAFSNSQYYGSKLCTFPSPDNRVSKVSFVKVDGHYDKGKSRQNKAEAQAVVEEVVRRLSDPQLSQHSIGIVTFSVVQQALIDDMLSEVFAKNAALEEKANQCDEPLFVKNLENVQGDERDVILFSVGYGPDANGAVSMNFGPLNQVGGERRLNVAVSRARYEMKVFSTLTADMIDMNRTNAEGVRGLKEFLAFAQNGTRVLTEADMETVKGYESIANVVANELRRRGYDADTQVGCSSFRVDVAVVDPADKGRYLLGILCDGVSYCNAQTARDREVCQPGMLNGLGWNLMKVWTIDWWEDKETVLKKIENAIKAAQNGKSNRALLSTEVKTKEVKLEEVEENVSIPESAGIMKKAYVLADLGDNDLKGRDFVDLSPKVLVRQLQKVVDTEAPITASLLFHRVMEAWAYNRMTKKEEAFLFNLLNEVDCRVLKDDRQIVVWKNDQDPASYAQFRTPSERASSDIPLVEYMCAMRFVLGQQLSLSSSDLKKSASQQLGFARLGGKLNDFLDCSVQMLETQNVVSIENDIVKLC